MATMAFSGILPVVKNLQDCSDFTKTVLPFLPQLRPLPQLLFESWNDFAALQNIYLTTNPLITGLAFSLFISPIFLLVSEINRNYSQVDRMWSILPTIYNVHYCVWAHYNGLNTTRLDHLIAASITWSIRLTYNYWRKGGYSIGSEDYRWALLRERINKPLFFIFNVLFISLAQSILLFLITTPVYPMLLTTLVPKADPMSKADTIFARGILVLVVLEYFADQTQWTYQTAKSIYHKTAKPPRGYDQTDLDRGFCTTGLWSYSRHPNFLFEQSVWVALYQWGCWDTNVLFNWTSVGAIGYLILFQASTWFTEKITAGKYADYKEYQKRTGKFLPKIKDVVGLFVMTEEEKEQERLERAKPKEGPGKEISAAAKRQPVKRDVSGRR